MGNLHSRRDFMKLAAAGTLGAVVLSNYSCKKQLLPGIGIQLYTIRDAMMADPAGSLKRVADTGYKYLELAGYADGRFYGYEPAEFKKLVNDLGMEILSSHTQVEAEGITLENATKMAEDHARLEVRYCIQPWVVEEARTTIASYQKMAADWNQVGQIMKDYGIKFGYHNHNFEFDTVEGMIPYFDVFMAELDKDLVTMEIDIFWTIKAGQDPVEIINRYPGRFELFHMKDMFTEEPPFFTTDGVRDFAPVGAGVIDFKRILAASETAGMKYMIVEQDLSRDNDPFRDIQTSITNLQTKILV
ncbi:MAG: sugar phosphate isomerase/epimerase [Bacteroidales bacterium]|jgi:sugar phosphate isomerase/epimerase|nr:sugar phosphate isomerase/epimerase [Bacteroidales bacterium]